MISSYALQQCFLDTQRMIREDAGLRRSTERMQAGTLLFLPGYCAVCPAVKSAVPVISVTEDTTFHCAQSFLQGNDRVAVLNFANAYSPGGGVKNGAMAQEECLCRSSNLYLSLTVPYIIRNYYNWNSSNTGDMGTDTVIYSPGVTVFKTDDDLPQLLGSPFRTDVLTCAAPYYDPLRKKPVSPEKLTDVFRSRIANILEVAAAMDVDVLVLGAFGCGAFNNPPELVAEAFRHCLVDQGRGRFFRKVVFAIKKRGTNYDVFRDVLDKQYSEKTGVSQ